ncbi:hydroxymethylglutaryl-CoA lyase [Streptomyces sp. NPDC006332]|uniref:hydroxymethylglutaryl-CoA lyase n=1 Tax=Streptomyces sp. NPDC006332 TaxID=3155456 RepID=UPI0033BF4C37
MTEPVVSIREVAPRDGLQLEKPLDRTDKARVLESLVATGATRIEATAFVSPRAVPSMADAEYVAELVTQWPGVEWSALVASVGGAERAIRAGFRTIEYVVSVADGHSQANVRRTTAESLDLVGRITELVHEASGRCEVILATAWDCPFDGRTSTERTVRLAAGAVTAGADIIGLGDTVGTVVPGRVTSTIDAVRTAVPGTPLAVHMHNTRGTGLASAWAAIEAGVTMVDASAGGFGGCPFAPGATGNIATEELVYLLEDSGISTGLDLDAVMRAGRLLETVLGHPGESQLLRAGGRLRTRPPVTVS